MHDIKYILICGAGMMGKNIAYVMSTNPNFQVGVYDLFETDVYAGIRTSTKELVAKGVIKHDYIPVKVLGDGELTKSLTVAVDKVSASAKAKIEAAGGKVE